MNINNAVQNTQDTGLYQQAVKSWSHYVIQVKALDVVGTTLRSSGVAVQLRLTGTNYS
jgi:hypothetical protein